MSIPAHKLARIYLRDKGICGICGQPIDPDNFDIDHIVQKAEGGSDDDDNLRATHASCNRSRPRVKNSTRSKATKTEPHSVVNADTDDVIEDTDDIIEDIKRRYNRLPRHMKQEALAYARYLTIREENERRASQ